MGHHISKHVADMCIGGTVKDLTPPPLGAHNSRRAQETQMMTDQ